MKMQINIHYCTVWNYQPKAASLAEELHNELGLDAKLVPGQKGVFNVVVDGQLVFSKHETGRFPEKGEIVDTLR